MEIKVTSIKFNERELNRFCEELVDEFLEEGKSKIKDKLALHEDTGETIASVRSERIGNEGKIMVGGAGVWLEFGTGVLKNPTPHPNSVNGVVPHGTYGKGNGSDPRGWVYQKDGKFYRTKGIAQTRFMYNTGEELKSEAQEIANKVASKWK